MATSVVYHQGVEYLTLKSFATAFGLDYGRTVARLRAGWTPEQITGHTPRKRVAHNALRIEHEGRVYTSIRDLAAHIGVQASTLQARLARGATLDDAIKGNSKQRRGNGKQFSAFGRSWDSMEAFARDHGLRASVIARRLKRGWTLEQAADLDPPPARFRDFEGHARNSKYKTERTSLITGTNEPIPDHGGYKLYVIRCIKTSKVYVGITIGALEARLRQHFSAVRRGRKSSLCNAIRKYGEASFQIELLRDDAKSFEELQQQEIDEIASRDSIRKGYNTALGGSIGTSKPVEVNGLRFLSRAQAAEYYGVDQSVFNLRLNRLNWTPEQAAGVEAVEWAAKPKQVQVGGLIFNSISEASTRLGVSKTKVYSRLQRGWSVEEAFEVAPLPSTTINQGVAVTIGGQRFASISEAAKHLGFNAESFRKSLKVGRTPDDAFARLRVVRRK